jgi:hypothetical protein
LAENTYHAKWVLEIADRGRKFAFRQVGTSHECGTKPTNTLSSIRLLFSRWVNKIVENVDGSGGVEGYCWITYMFREAGCGLTLFTRNLTCELETGVEVPEDLWLPC